MERRTSDIIDDAVTTFDAHGVVGIVALVSLVLVLGTMSWVVVSDALERTAEQDQAALALLAMQELPAAAPVLEASGPDVSPDILPEETTPEPLLSSIRIGLIGDDVARIRVGESYTDDGVAILEGEGTIRTFVNGTLVEGETFVDASVPSTHTIVYRATDAEGAQATLTRTVIVE